VRVQDVSLRIKLALTKEIEPWLGGADGAWGIRERGKNVVIVDSVYLLKPTRLKPPPMLISRCRSEFNGKEHETCTYALLIKTRKTRILEEEARESGFVPTQAIWLDGKGIPLEKNEVGFQFSNLERLDKFLKWFRDNIDRR